MGITWRGKSDLSADADMQCTFCRREVEVADAREFVMLLPRGSHRQSVVHLSCVEQWRRTQVAEAPGSWRQASSRMQVLDEED